MDRVVTNGNNWKPGEKRGGPNTQTSYANSSKGPGTDRLDINVINVRIKRDHQMKDIQFDDAICQKVCESIRINPKTDTKGSQYLNDKGGITLVIWLRDNVLVRSSDEAVKVGPGFKIESVHPAGRKQVPLMIIGLEQDVPDSVTIEYIKLFGLKPTHDRTDRLLHKDGIWKGQVNEDRRVKVDISEQITPTSTKHSIRGRRIQIVYHGNSKTCGNCHKTPTRTNGGLVIHLNDHMKTLHSELEKLWNKTSSTQVVDTDEIVVDTPTTSESPSEDLINLSHDGKQEEFSNHRGTTGNIKTNDPNFPSLSQATQQEVTIPKIPGLYLTKAQKKNLKNKKKKSIANEAEVATNYKNKEASEDSESDSDYETQKDLIKPPADKMKDNQIKITDYYSKDIKEDVNPPLDEPRNNNKVDDESNKEAEDHSKSTITDEEENLEELFKSLTTDNKGKDITTNHSTTFFEDNHYKIHETYPSIFEKGGHNSAKEAVTPSRMLKPPSFSTPKSGTPKRSRSESPNDMIIGIKTIKFSTNDVDLPVMNFINPFKTKEEEANKIDDDSSTAEVPASS